MKEGDIVVVKFYDPHGNTSPKSGILVKVRHPNWDLGGKIRLWTVEFADGSNREVQEDIIYTPDTYRDEL